MSTVKVSAPATATNLGPGYDSVALALGLYNTVELVEVDQGIHIGSIKERKLSTPVLKAAVSVYQAAGRAPGGLKVRVEQNIPWDCGLGCKESLMLAGAVAANVMIGTPLSHEQLLDIAIKRGGHPAALLAAINGGMYMCSYDSGSMLYRPADIAPMRVVVVRPEVDDSYAQLPLPETVSISDAAFNIGRSLLVMHSFQQADYKLLSESLEDRLQQKTRTTLIPGYDKAAEVAQRYGASAVALCGTGPALIIFSESNHQEIQRVVKRVLKRASKRNVETWILSVDTQGVSISERAFDITAQKERFLPIPFYSNGPEAKAKKKA